MAEAVCVQCGAPKDLGNAACKRCGLVPDRDRETLIRSIYFSVDRFDDPAQQEAYEAELDRLSAEHQAGAPLPIDGAELDRVREKLLMIEQVRPADVAKYLMRFLLPGFLLILFAVGTGLVVKALR